MVNVGPLSDPRIVGITSNHISSSFNSGKIDLTYINPSQISTFGGEEGCILTIKNNCVVWSKPLDALIDQKLAKENKLVASSAEKLRQAYNEYVMTVKLINDK